MIEEAKKNFKEAISIILHGMLISSMRTSELVELVRDNCKGCSSFPDHIEPIKEEVDRIVRTVTDLIDCFKKEVPK